MIYHNFKLDSDRILRQFSHVSYAFGALALFLATAIPSLLPSSVSAAQVQTRSIKMSDSSPSATGVTYSLTFTPATAEQEIVVDFCSNSPIITDTCSYSASTTPDTTSAASSLGTGATLGSGNHTVKITGLSTMTGGSPFTVNITNMKNPTAATPTGFYARVYTYATNGSSTFAPATTSGGSQTTPASVDYGGIALATATVINLTAKVMESLSFCVYLSTCGDNPSINLGHGTNTILDGSAVDTANVNFSISTNAKNGATINLKGDTLKTSTGSSIPAAGASPVAIVANTASFGMYVATSGTNITSASPYQGASSTYGLDVTTAGNNVTATFGDTIATLSGATNSSISTLKFGATAGPTTAAGVYTAAEQIIAVGQY